MKHVIRRYLKPLVIWILQGILSAAFVLLFAFLLVEWATGCGESYTDSKGKVHTNECVHHTIYDTIRKGTN
jgi:hypothetical protein